MNDQRIVEVIGRCIGLAMGHTFANVRTMTPGPNTLRIASNVLAALRSEGWELYRPAFEAIEIWYCDDCALGAEFRSDLACPHADALPTYRLVPVESEDRQ